MTDYTTYHQRKRKAALKVRSPVWRDLKKIGRLYSQARIKSLRTGIPHVVDHIIPLQGKKVSGLHVEENLRVVTYSENAEKHANHLQDL